MIFVAKYSYNSKYVYVRCSQARIYVITKWFFVYANRLMIKGTKFIGKIWYMIIWEIFIVDTKILFEMLRAYSLTPVLYASMYMRCSIPMLFLWSIHEKIKINGEEKTNRANGTIKRVARKFFHYHMTYLSCPYMYCSIPASCTIWNENASHFLSVRG